MPDGIRSNQIPDSFMRRQGSERADFQEFGQGTDNAPVKLRDEGQLQGDNPAARPRSDPDGWRN